jgi:DNA ligase-1
MQRRHFLEASLFGLAGLIPGIARAGLPDIALPSVYRPGIDPAPYWISEKLDGVRATWDGGVLRFRSGRVVEAPRWFIDGLPPTPLDGELWIGRASFDRLSATVRKSPPEDEAWKQVRYMIFELPGAPGSFTERIAQTRRIVDAASAGAPWLRQVEQFRVADDAALMRRLKEVARSGGEGLVLHLAGAPYVTGRTDVLLKLKPVEDAEATVVAHLPGKGRNAGRMGALLVEAPDGRRFRIGTGFTDAQREAPPPVGSVVTYRYRDLTGSGLPRFASFLRTHEGF